MPNINGLLARSMMAYRKGVNKPVSMRDHTGESSFNELTRSFINNSLPSASRNSYEIIMYLTGLAETLRNQTLTEDSEHILDLTGEYIVKSADSKMLCYLGKACILQAKSELDIQKTDYQAARDNILQSIQIELILEKEYSMTFLHIARLKQVLLFIKACAGAGEESIAIALAQEAVAYLCGISSKLSVSEGWSQDLVRRIPESSRNALIAQFASEAGCILAVQPEDAASALFLQFNAWKYFTGHDQLKEIHDWGELKKAYFDKDYETFLTYCIPFLQSGRRETLLWDTTALDLCRCCRILKPVQTAEFLKEVSDNAIKMRDVPPGGYSLPTEIRYKRIFVVKERSYPAFVLPPELRSLLEDIQTRPATVTDCLVTSSRPSRRFHAYNVGLPRSGCSSIMALFSNYRSVAEYKERESVELITAWRDGWIGEETLQKYIRYRHDAGQLEMDTASFNHFYLHILINEFPRAKFIYTIRDCYSWVNSFLRMISRWKKHFLDIGQDMPDWMLNYGRILFGEYDWNWFNSYQALQENLDPLTEMFIRGWGRLNARILDMLPSERSLIIRTSDISRSQTRLADFIGIPAASLTVHHHINMAPDNINILEDYDREKFDALCYQYGKPVMDRLEHL